MGPHATDADDQANGPTPYPSSLKRLSVPPVSPRLRVRPWWFPAHELRDPLVFYMEAWVAEMIFGPKQVLIPEIEWLSQALLTVDIVDSGNVAEITIYGRPCVKSRMQNILLHLAACHKEEHVQRATKMRQLEEFLKNHSPNSNRPQEPRQEALAD